MNCIDLRLDQLEEEMLKVSLEHDANEGVPVDFKDTEQLHYLLNKKADILQKFEELEIEYLKLLEALGGMPEGI